MNSAEPKQGGWPPEAVNVLAEQLCAVDYRDDSGGTWGTLSDVGQDSFRMQARLYLDPLSRHVVPRQQLLELAEDFEERAEEGAGCCGPHAFEAAAQLCREKADA